MKGSSPGSSLTRRRCSTAVDLAKLEERLFQATHTHEEVLIRDMQVAARPAAAHAGNEKMQALLTRVYDAEAVQVTSGGAARAIIRACGGCWGGMV